MNNELITIDNNNIPCLTLDAASKLVFFEHEMRNCKKKADAIKAALLEEMESKGIIKLETDEISIAYIAGFDRETFDAKAFKQDNPETYDEYVRFTPVKSSIRVKVK